MTLLILLLILLCGCASDIGIPQTLQSEVLQLPIKIKDKAKITIVPVLPLEQTSPNKPLEDFVRPDSKNKYEQDKYYTNVLASRIKDNLEKQSFVSLVTNAVSLENLDTPQFFEVLNLSYPSDYWAILYLYKITDTEKKIRETLSYDKDGVYPAEQWEQESKIHTRLELYESPDYCLIWQSDITTISVLTTERIISKTKPLDDLVHSLMQPHYYEEVNNSVITKAAQEMIDDFQSLSVEIRPKHLVKVEIYLYDKKISPDTFLKKGKIKITNLTSSKQNGNQEQEFVTDEAGEVRIKLPKGFYKIEASILPPNGELRSNTIQTLVIGDVRRINLVIH